VPDLVLEAANTKLTTELRQTRIRLAKALLGLQHYADPKHYTPEGVVTDGGAFGWDHPDRGAYARQVIKEIGPLA
jgi:hypothetical protein